MKIIPEKFEDFEMQYSLFDIRVDDIAIWEMIRHSVYREIKRQNGERKAHSKVGGSIQDYLRGFGLVLRNLVDKNPYFARETNYLFFGHSRRKRGDDGKWLDIYCDPLYDSYSFDYLHLESPYRLQHWKPAKTENLRYRELITYGAEIKQILGVNKPTIPKSTQATLEAAEETLRSEFNTDIDLAQYFRSKAHEHGAEVQLYKYLLERIDPKIVIVVVSYSDGALIDACKQQEIPVAELQHGVIHQQHFAYSFRGSRTKEMFPDYLLVWGEYWKEAVEYPIPDERVIPVGYPYLEQTVEKYEDTQSRDQILFISQGTIGAQLSKFAVEVNQHPDINHDVVYKLHPGEYDRWRDEYPWLINTDFEIIDTSEPPLYELFAESSIQIGVGSTAVYEGLCFDLETYVYDCPGSSVLDALVKEGAAKVISSVEELKYSLGTERVSFDREHYFEPNATENIYQNLQQLAD